MPGTNECGLSEFLLNELISEQGEELISKHAGATDGQATSFPFYIFISSSLIWPLLVAF